ncbi:penicillin-binding protein 1A [Sphingomonas sp. LHG3443-2]|uniref:penicillin-binding protein 1A n=1 Tax=Sphingomonas sp. LHG3443-2 TaxID=2804639 RepID=UPI003CEADCE8
MDAVATSPSPAWMSRHHSAADRLRAAWRGNRLLRWLGLGVLAGYFLFVLVWLFFAAGLPSSEKLLAYQPPLPSNIRGVDGQPVGTFARERRVELSYNEYPPMVIQAFISAEDKTFFSHGGIDYPGLVGAVGDFALKSATGGARARGGSTITQQVAKALLQDDEYAVSRKIREAILAFRLENTLTKEQILELYLNQIFLGRNAYGVQAAARAYFDKDVADLTLPEAAYLAILPKAPSNYDPVRQTQRALDRRNYVLREMVNNGYVTQADASVAGSSPLGTIRLGSNAKFREVGGYFTEEVRRELLRRYGEDAGDSANSVYAGGLWVRTSMNPVMQDAAAEALREGLAKFDGGRGWRDTGLSIDTDGDWRGQLDRAPLGTGFPDWRKAVVLDKGASSASIGFTDGSTGTLAAGNATMPRRGGGGTAFSNLKDGMIIIVKQIAGEDYAIRSIPEIGGGFVAQEVRTGRVLAMQGGFDSIGASYNRATQAQRQPGSTFKPIVYYTALANGMTPATLIDDAPFCVWQGAGLGNKCFRNFDANYAGPKTLRWGVEQSRNLMTVRAASQTGMAKVTDTARRLGVGDYPNYLSIALGAGDTTVLKLTNAYAILANHGRAVAPTLIDFVQDRDGKVIFRTDNRCQVMEGRCNAPDWDGGAMPRPPSRSRQVLDPQAAFQMVHVMTGVIERGTATTLRDLNRPLFGKTGTTTGPTNVWFVGGTPDVVAGTYIGYDQPRSLGGAAQGGRIAAPIFKQWAEVAFKDVPPTPFVAPKGIRMVRIDRVTGRRVFGTFPVREDPKSAVIWEAFQPETEPRRTLRRAGEEQELAAAAAKAAPARRRAPPPRPRETAPRPAEPAQPAEDFLARQGGIY